MSERLKPNTGVISHIPSQCLDWHSKGHSQLRSKLRCWRKAEKRTWKNLPIPGSLWLSFPNGDFTSWSQTAQSGCWGQGLPFALCNPDVTGKWKSGEQTPGIIIITVKDHIQPLDQVLLVLPVAEFAKTLRVRKGARGVNGDKEIWPFPHWGGIRATWLQGIPNAVPSIAREQRDWSSSKEVPRGKYTQHAAQLL